MLNYNFSLVVADTLKEYNSKCKKKRKKEKEKESVTLVFRLEMLSDSHPIS